MIIFAGLIAGLAHVITGPDHLAALAPLAVENPKRARALGFKWGLGHGLGAALLGALGILLKSSLDIAAWSAWAEFAVGFLLLFIGLWSFKKASKIVVHSHGHSHDHTHHDQTHHHHLHVHDTAHDGEAPEQHQAHTHAAFAVGMLHGGAGTGHLLGVIPSLALPTEQAILYLLAYFTAAVLAMTGVGSLIGSLISRWSQKGVRTMMYSASGAAMALGGFWIIQNWPA
jgi:hypothetical protein